MKELVSDKEFNERTRTEEVGLKCETHARKGKHRTQEKRGEQETTSPTALSQRRNHRGQ